MCPITQLNESQRIRILALTRSSASPAAQALAKLPGVEVLEQNWVDINPAWLHDHEVFAEESHFHLSLLKASVKYVVRISTTAANALLASPEFSTLHWTSLQPKVFSDLYLSGAAQLIKEYKKTGKQPPLSIMASEDTPVGIIHPYDVGTVAAALLTQEDTSVHNKKNLVLNGPEDITGTRIVKLVEQHIGVPVEKVAFKDLSFIDSVPVGAESKTIILSIKGAQRTAWDGLCSTTTTSKEVFKLAPPTKSPADVLKTLMET